MILGRPCAFIAESASKVSYEQRQALTVRKRLDTDHLKAKRSINHDEDQICDLCNVDNSSQFVWAFDERYSTGFAYTLQVNLNSLERQGDEPLTTVTGP